MRVEVLLTETELADEFVKAFQNRNLPEKFFYWMPLSVKAWLDLCGNTVYRNFIRSFDLISESAEEIAFQLPAEVEVFSIGCGQGNKDQILLRKIDESGRRPFYVPVDSSQALLEMACATSEESGVPYRAWKLDVTKEEHLVAVERTKESRLFLILGNTLGGFSPVELCRTLRRLSRPGDFLLADGEIQSSETMAGYDNPINRRFAFAPLAGAGINEEDGQLIFEMKEDLRRQGLFYLTKYFQPSRDLRLNLAGSTINIIKEEKLAMNHSCKYTRNAFLDLLQEEAGSRPLMEFLSRDGRFLMVLARF